MDRDFATDVTHHWTSFRDAEVDKWDKYFAEALSGRGQEHEDTLWWRISDRDSFDLLKILCRDKAGVRVLEPACGSGGTSLALPKHLDVANIILMDGSPNALRFAKDLIPRSLRDRVTIVRGDAFCLPFKDRSFDIVWNVGVIEHYLKPAIVDLASEMLRVARQDGFVVLGIPNRHSAAVLKAYVLGTKWGRRWLKFLRGYRFDTEILYGNQEIAELLSRSFDVDVKITYGGSLLWVGADERLVRIADRLFRGSMLSFLTFFVLSPHRCSNHAAARGLQRSFVQPTLDRTAIAAPRNEYHER